VAVNLDAGGEQRRREDAKKTKEWLALDQARETFTGQVNPNRP